MFLIKNLNLFLNREFKLKFFLISILIFIGTVLETFSIGFFIPLLNFIVKGKDYFVNNEFVLVCAWQQVKADNAIVAAAA